MKQIIAFLIIFSLVVRYSYSQNDCECCTYRSIDVFDRFEEFFPPQIIDSLNYSEAEVFIELNGNKNSKYLKYKIQFNDKGFVTRNSTGMPHILYEFERNSENFIIKENFWYVTDSGEKESHTNKTKQYYYSETRKVSRIVESNYDIINKADRVSAITFNSYDTNGYLKYQKRVNYYQFGEVDSTYYVHNIEYSDNYINGVETIEVNGKLWLTNKIEYEQYGKEKFVYSFNHSLNDNSKEYFEYNNKKLIKYRISSSEQTITECPENLTFTDEYFYNKTGLLDKISHSYKDQECLIKVYYK